MPHTNAQLDAATNEIRTSDAVVVLGAGASFMAGMPLAGQLAPLVWQALDTHPEIRLATCHALGIGGESGKEIIGNDWNRIRSAFAQIAASPATRATFQNSFVRLDQGRAAIPSHAHTALARLVHAERVSHVVSLNWDTLLEAAFKRLYGIDINAQGSRLSKPHGNCRWPQDNWVLPHEPGSIPNDLVERMTALATERPRALLIVGYSERDEVVVERLIRPLVNCWRVFRISPSVTGEGAIPLPAHEALAFIADQVCPDLEPLGWDYVSFADQRGIEAAISGERLGRKDVKTCPRLPNFNPAALNLDLLHTVEITGNPGCGKSITAWQLAYMYNEQGWEVLRPVLTQVSAARQTVHGLAGNSWKKVLVIDDTQTFPEGFAEEIADLAGPWLKVIRATTDTTGERTASVRISAKAAVDILAEQFRVRRTEILPIVHCYDPAIGDGRFDVSLEDRIDAAKESETPWQFGFILRGGWRQVREKLNILRDFCRSDLLLVLVAARQLVSLDAGCTIEEIIQDARHLGRNEEWVRSSFTQLSKQGVILASDRLRCPHIQSAVIIIHTMFSDRKDVEFQKILLVVRLIISSVNSPLRGISWLLSELLHSRAFGARWDQQLSVLTSEQRSALVCRCFTAVTNLERRDAGFVLSTLIGYGELSPQNLLGYSVVLNRWLEMVNGADAYALGNVINNLYNENKQIAKDLVESIEPSVIASRLTVARATDGYSWGYLLGRLCCAAGDTWRLGLKSSLPKDQIRVLVNEFKPTELDSLSRFLVGLGGIDLDFATECLKQVMPSIQAGFATNPLKALAETNELRWCFLGHNPFIHKPPNKRQLKLSKTITSAIRPERVAAGIELCRYGDWEGYSERLSGNKTLEIKQFP